MIEREPGLGRAWLQALIRTAFADVPYPGDDALVSGDVTYDPEYREVARDFRGKTWRALSREHVRAHADALPLLTTAAFRYFLPGYLLACLEVEAELDTAPLNVVFSLTPPDSADPAESEDFAARVAVFGKREAQAICSYLDACQARDPNTATARALDYWRSRPR
jgi:hypothetical protein